ncbi:DUF3558 domain-containing protein [Saccharomonospora halophila]|uniref:DUF3558 domain-containing protein n=1 Tax=Saccharomonospora halophila TaxID=129922 RepID=UPI000A049295|nr:DUF3558 domain-containing protein [Saccharomonospora halophila]
MTTVRRESSSIVGLALALLLTSCAESESGTPTTLLPDLESASTSPTEASGDIPIEEPLDVAHLLDQPCTALNDEDLADLSLAEGKLSERTISQAAESCMWRRSDDSGSHADIIVMTENSDGLEDIRERNQDSEVLEEVQIGGYPALHASPTDRRDVGRCELWIGVNDSEVAYFYVALHDLPDASDPCGFADKVGEAVIANLSF